MERTWEKQYWTERCRAPFLEITEANKNYLRGYLVNGARFNPQLDFWRHLGWDVGEFNLDEEEEAIGFKGIRLRVMRGTSGEHELVTALKY